MIVSVPVLAVDCLGLLAWCYHNTIVLAAAGRAACGIQDVWLCLFAFACNLAAIFSYLIRWNWFGDSDKYFVSGVVGELVCWVCKHVEQPGEFDLRFKNWRKLPGLLKPVKCYDKARSTNRPQKHHSNIMEILLPRVFSRGVDICTVH